MLKRVFSSKQPPTASHYSDAEGHSPHFTTPAQRLVEHLNQQLLEAQRELVALRQARSAQDAELQQLRRQQQAAGDDASPAVGSMEDLDALQSQLEHAVEQQSALAAELQRWRQLAAALQDQIEVKTTTVATLKQQLEEAMQRQECPTPAGAASVELIPMPRQRHESKASNEGDISPAKGVQQSEHPQRELPSGQVAALQAQLEELCQALRQRDQEIEQLERLRRDNLARVADARAGANGAARWCEREAELLSQLQAQRVEAEAAADGHARALEALQAEARLLSERLGAAIDSSQAAAEAAKEHAAVGAAAAAAAARHVGLLREGEELRADQVIQQLSAQLSGSTAASEQARRELGAERQRRERLAVQLEAQRAALEQGEAAHAAAAAALEDRIQALASQARGLGVRLDAALGAAAEAAAAAQAHAEASQAAAVAAARHLTLSKAEPEGLDVAVVVEQLSALLEGAERRAGEAQQAQHDVAAELERERQRRAEDEDARQSAEARSEQAAALHVEVQHLRQQLDLAVREAQAASAAAQAHSAASAAAAALAARHAAHLSQASGGEVDVAAVLHDVGARMDASERQLAEAATREAALLREIDQLQEGMTASEVSSRAAADTHAELAAQLQRRLEELQGQVDRAAAESAAAAAAAAAHAAASRVAAQAAQRHFKQQEGGEAGATDVGLLIHRLSEALSQAEAQLAAEQSAAAGSAAEAEGLRDQLRAEQSAKNAALEDLRCQVVEAQAAASAAERAASAVAAAAAEVASAHGLVQGPGDEAGPGAVVVLQGLSNKLADAERRAGEGAAQLAAAERDAADLRARVHHLQAAAAAAAARSAEMGEEHDRRAAELQREVGALREQLDQAVSASQAAAAAAAAHAAASLAAQEAAHRHLRQGADLEGGVDVGATVCHLSAALDSANAELAAANQRAAGADDAAAHSSEALAAATAQLAAVQHGSAVQEEQLRQLRDEAVQLRREMEAAVAQAAEAASAAAAHAAASAAALGAWQRHLPQTVLSEPAGKVDVAAVVRLMDAELEAAAAAQREQADELTAARAQLQAQRDAAAEVEAAAVAAAGQHAAQVAALQRTIKDLQQRLETERAAAVVAPQPRPWAAPSVGPDSDESMIGSMGAVAGAAASETASLGTPQESAAHEGAITSGPPPLHPAASAASIGSTAGSAAAQPPSPPSPEPRGAAVVSSSGEVQRLRQELRRREAEVQRLLGVVATLQNGHRSTALPAVDAVPAVDTLQARLEEEARGRAELTAAYADLKAQLKAKTQEVDSSHRELTKAQAKAEAERIRREKAAKDAIEAAHAESAAAVAKAAAAEAVAAALRAEAEEAEAARTKAQLAAADSPAGYSALEMRRLTEENAALGSVVSGMEAELLETRRLLGHSNAAQKVQYHQRLKAQVEEMRREANAALRARFELEQCVRYLAVKAALPEAAPGFTDATGAVRAATAVLQPPSLVGQAGALGGGGALPQAPRTPGNGGGGRAGAAAASGGDALAAAEEEDSAAAIERRIRRRVAEVCAAKKTQG